MSEPQHVSEKIELETVVSWRMIAVGAGLGAAAIVAAFVVLLVAGPRPVPGKEQAVAPRPAAPAPERTTAQAAPRKSPPPAERPAPPVVAAPELLPPPVVTTPARPSRPARVAALPAAPAAKETVRKAEAPVFVPPSFKRMRPYGETELLYLLEKQSRDLDLDATAATCKKILEEAAKGPMPDADRRARDVAFPLPTVQPVLDLFAARDDLKGLPVRKGSECQSDPRATTVMARMSRELRTRRSPRGQRSQPGESFHEVMERDQELVKFVTSQKGWTEEAAIPGLVQMLQAENEPVRAQLVATLASITGEKATAALAQRAVFDPSPVVREAAVKALADRPRKEFRPVLFDGLRYPWAPAAEHAAEALVALKDQEAIVPLVGLLDLPDPLAPVRDENKKWVATEVVRVNHLRNCLLCHAPSFTRTEPMRALVPEKGKPLPEAYYDSRDGSFVRADVVYLKQDFSVTQPVSKPDKWPVLQRFDYLTRKRELTRAEVLGLPVATAAKAPPAYPQRQAVLWALRELTGVNAGERGEDWYRTLSGW